MESPPSRLRAAGAYALQQLRRLIAAIRQHPVQALFALPVLILIYVVALIPFTPGIGDLRKAKAATPSVVMSTDGVVLAEFKRINREWVTLEKIAPSVVDALIATEDHRFYEHHGIDPKRTVAAMLNTLSGDLQGGSTITQQLARNLYPEEIGRATTLTRKVKEAITALKIEALYTKREILETYLNTVPFLFNAFGIEMAARTYFDKSAAELNVLESATLIGMLKATSAFNPVLNPERARERRNLVLSQMAKRGKLSAAQLATLSRRPLKLDFARQIEPPGPAPHIVRLIRKWLIEWADKNDYDVYSEGLVVRSTLDSRLQDAANQAVARQMKRLHGAAEAVRRRDKDNAVLQAGFMAMDPRDGAVRAWVGSRDFATEEFDHVGQARRQPGSAFKPFVYGAALTMGLAPTMTLIDQPVTIRLPGGGGVWQPGDVSPPSYAPMTLRSGLVYSKNTITAQLMEKVGAERVVRLAQAMGVRHSKLDPVLSLALGTSPVTLREMVTAYGVIANGGTLVEPMVVTRVEDRRGRVLVEFEARRETVDALPRAHALELVNMMRGVIDQGTATAIRYRYGISADVAGKTGTTQENTDGWFIMMHPHLVAGARVGFNDRLTMGTWGQGARSALPIVGEVFREALRNGVADPKAEFAIARTRPQAPPEPEPELEPEPGSDIGMAPGAEPGSDAQRQLDAQSQGLPFAQPQAVWPGQPPLQPPARFETPAQRQAQPQPVPPPAPIQRFEPQAPPPPRYETPQWPPQPKLQPAPPPQPPMLPQSQPQPSSQLPAQPQQQPRPQQPQLPPVIQVQPQPQPSVQQQQQSRPPMQPQPRPVPDTPPQSRPVADGPPQPRPVPDVPPQPRPIPDGRPQSRPAPDSAPQPRPVPDAPAPAGRPGSGAEDPRMFYR